MKLNLKILHGSFSNIKIPIILFSIFINISYANSFEFPAAGWHRGDVSIAQENSKKAITAALGSKAPNLEIDILDFVNENGIRIGLLAHDYEMERITGSKGRFIDHSDISELPPNSANPDLSPEPFISVIDLFEIIKEYKNQGFNPIVSLDMKEEGKNGEEFGRWVGEMIIQYNLQENILASSFYKSNVLGVKTSCPECMIGGLIFNDHWALKSLDYQHSSLDLTAFSKMTFFLGFLGKEEFPHDFILIQDDIFFNEPGLIDYWRNVRKVKYVGVFTYNKKELYTEDEIQKLQTVDWLEIDKNQIEQIMKARQ